MELSLLSEMDPVEKSAVCRSSGGSAVFAMKKPSEKPESFLLPQLDSNQ